MDVRIYDTTLRDGCQGSGISLSLQDKLDVARRLDEFGVDYIEGGWPGSNPKDAKFFSTLREAPLQNARVAAFGATRKVGIRAEDDANLRALLEAGTPVVTLVAKTWDFHVRAVLRTTEDENLAMVRDSVRWMKVNGKEVVLDAEHFFDGYRANREHSLNVLRVAVEAGADWLCLCDTNGGSLPEQISAAIADVRGVVGTNVGIGIHTHNDSELAVANALAAVAAGATQVQGTINGYGERAGNTNLCSLLPDLAIKMRRSFRAAGNLADLTAVSRFVDEVANVTPNPRLPYVGYAAFGHKGGIHVQAIAIDPSTYEHVEPRSVGNERRVLMSELAGRRNVTERAKELGIEIDPDGPVARELAAKIKDLEDEGFQFEDAGASLELLLRRHQSGYDRLFKPISYSVESKKSSEHHGTESTASVEVAVRGQLLRATAAGGGPVDAIEKALRRALAHAYPWLDQLTLIDFRSQIVGGRSTTRAPVRVRITARTPDGRTWTTVGSSTDFLHASWLAVTDSIEFAIMTRRGSIAPPADVPPPPMPLAEIAPLLRRRALDVHELEVLRRLQHTNWSRTKLNLADAADRAFAAQATSLGAVLFYSFGNFCAVAARPELESVRRVNLMKGRPIGQVGSVTTTRARIRQLFDWSKVPAGLDPDRVVAIMDAFYELGPMGFRGPAAPAVPDHLTSMDGGVRTTQNIAPGHRCPSNALLADLLERVHDDFLFITSANVSSGRTGKVEAAHYELGGIQQDFGNRDGVVFIGHADEATVRASYPKHLPMSTSILAFHRLDADDDGKPALILERHGSLDIPDVRALCAKFGFGLVLGPGARERLPARAADGPR